MVEAEFAKAIYDLALEEQKLDSFCKCFETVSEALEYKEFFNLMTSPTVTDEDKKQVIDKVFSQLDSTFVIFLKVLVDHHRIIIFRDIYSEYKKLVLSSRNTMKIKVISADKLTENQNMKIYDALQNKYKNNHIVIENYVDPTLIGGIRIVTNGQSLDISVKNSLDKLKISL